MGIKSPFDMPRYVNALAKERVLADFSECRSQRFPVGVDQGGKGYPDPEILSFCDWINTFNGMCTLQSCTGHPPRAGQGASAGVLWVWLDREYTDLFRLRVYDLVQHPLIEKVQHVYARWGEFAEIIFKGNESGQLVESLSRDAFLAHIS